MQKDETLKPAIYCYAVRRRGKRPYISLLCYLFFTEPLIFQSTERPPSTVCQMLGRRSSTKNDLDISAIPSLIFIREVKSEIWPRFSTPVTFESPLFQNGATHLKSKTIIGLRSAHTWYSLVYSPKRKWGYEIVPKKTGWGNSSAISA